MDESEQERQSPAHHVELTSKKAFTEIFGDTGKSETRQLLSIEVDLIGFNYTQVPSRVERDQLSHTRL